ncbi:hypothetical protein D3C85_272630 [compost metagenome]
MKYDEVKALVTLAAIDHDGIHKTPNLYWPDHANYDDMREKYPWWVVHVKGGGNITIGWRKRVICIDWSMTNRRGLITKDDVTKDDTMVHAWTIHKALEYLRAWQELPIVDVTAPGMKNYIVEGKDKVLETLKMLGDGSLEVDLLMSLVKEAKLGWTTVMSISRRGDSGYTFHLRVGKMSIAHYQPESK